MKKTRKMLLLTVLVASVAWPSEGARIPIPAAGVIYEGRFHGGPGCTGIGGLRFAGRMPAGNTVYPIVAGSQEDGCAWLFLTGGPLALAGETPSGRVFHWDCVGQGVWRKDPSLEDLAEDLGDPLSIYSDLEQTGIGHGGFITYSGSCATEGFAPRFILRMVLVLGGNETPYPYNTSQYLYPVSGFYWVKSFAA